MEPKLVNFAFSSVSSLVAVAVAVGILIDEFWLQFSG